MTVGKAPKPLRIRIAALRVETGPGSKRLEFERHAIGARGSWIAPAEVKTFRHRRNHRGRS